MTIKRSVLKKMCLLLFYTILYNVKILTSIPENYPASTVVFLKFKFHQPLYRSVPVRSAERKRVRDKAESETRRRMREPHHATRRVLVHEYP